MNKVTGLLIFITVSFTAKSVAQTAVKTSITRGEKVYKTVCLACHQADGQGVPRMAPTLSNTKWVLGNKKALSKIILNGLKGGEVEVEGDTFDNPMPPQATVLTDQQIADVLTFVRTSFGNKASAVTPAEVKAARGTSSKPVIQQVKTKIKTASSTQVKKSKKN
jgi:mono/diheme cytochrome c family protein